MKHSLILFLALLFLLLPKKICAQTPQEVEKKNNDQLVMCSQIKNTYQINVLNPRISPVVKVDLCELVINNRKESEIVYLNYGSNLVIKIYPKNQLATLPKNLPLFTYEK